MPEIISTELKHHPLRSAIKDVLAYLDDIFVFSSKPEEHMTLVDEVQKLLGSTRVSLKILKYQLFHRSLD